MNKNIYLLILLLPLQLKSTDSFHYNVVCGVIGCCINQTTGLVKSMPRKFYHTCLQGTRSYKNKKADPLITIQPLQTSSYPGRQSPQSDLGNIPSAEDSDNGDLETPIKKKKKKRETKAPNNDSDSDDGGLWIKIKKKKNKSIQN